MNSIIITIILLFASFFRSNAQVIQADKLKNEDAIKRPLTVHMHQLRVGSGLSFYNINKQYNENGQKELFSDIGRSTSNINIPIVIKYGLLDYLEIGISMKYTSSVFRDQGVLVLNTISPLASEISYTTFKKGFQEMNLLLKARIPGYNRKLGILFSLAYGIPFGQTKPSKPSHKFIYLEDTDTQIIRYVYNENWCTGSPSVQLGTSFKFRLVRFGITAKGSFRFPVQKSSSKYWNHRMIDNEFFYSNSDYEFLNPRELLLNLHFQYLLFPWFTPDVIVEYQEFSNGWTTQTGKKVNLQPANLFLISPGFEIIITHQLWLQQRIDITVTGQNALGFIGFKTLFLYNLFVK